MERPNIEQEFREWCTKHQNSTSSVHMFKVIVDFLCYLEKKIDSNDPNRFVDHY